MVKLFRMLQSTKMTWPFSPEQLWYDTACPSNLQCKGSSRVSCIDAMAEVASIQRNAMSENKLLLPRVRYLYY